MELVQLVEYGKEGFLQQVGDLVVVVDYVFDYMCVGVLVGFYQLCEGWL